MGAGNLSKNMKLRLTKKGRPDKRYCKHEKTKFEAFITCNEIDAMHDTEGNLKPLVPMTKTKVCQICNKAFWKETK